jgi:hypothetical protein
MDWVRSWKIIHIELMSKYISELDNISLFKILKYIRFMDSHTYKLFNLISTFFLNNVEFNLPYTYRNRDYTFFIYLIFCSFIINVWLNHMIELNSCKITSDQDIKIFVIYCEEEVPQMELDWYHSVLYTSAENWLFTIKTTQLFNLILNK